MFYITSPEEACSNLYSDHIMPGYTHLQLAMPVKFSQWLLSYGFSFVSDLERLREVLKRVNRRLAPPRINLARIIVSLI